MQKVKKEVLERVSYDKNKNIFWMDSKKVLKKDISEKIAKEYIERVDISYKELLGNVEKIISEIEFNSEKELTNYDKKLYEEKVKQKLCQIIKRDGDTIPLRVSRPSDSKELIFLVVKDFAKKIVTPIIAGSDKATRGEYLKGSKIMSSYIYKILGELEEDGLQATVDDVISEILYLVLDSKDSAKFFVDHFETLSTSTDVWATSYLDMDLVDSADESKIGAWHDFCEAIGDSEGWDLFCAWVWGIFDGRCIRKNRQSLWLWGQGYDGKSAVSRVLQHIIGGEMGSTYGSISLMADQLDKEFWASSIYGKSLAVLCEVTDPNFFGGRLRGKLHTWLGGDAAPIEEKGKGVFSAVLQARMLIHANVAPTFDAGYINALTRIIPVQIKKSHFKGLNYAGTTFAKSTFEEDLFGARYNFLRYCKKKFEEKYSDQDLFSISKEYQDNFFERSDKSLELDDISTYIDAGEDAYRPSDVKAFLFYISKNYFKKEFIGNRDLHYIYDKVGIKRTSLQRGASKILKCFIKRDYIEDYNNYIDIAYKGNLNLKIKKLNVSDDDDDVEFTNILKTEINLPKNYEE